jgi:hypothetical protein
MNMTDKFATSFVAVAAFSAILFTSANADSMKSAQSAAAPQASVHAMPISDPLNSKETPEDQLKDLQYN